MALPVTEEELQAQLNEARTSASTSAEKALITKLTEGTSFKSAEDIKKAYEEAQKKISEQGSELGELRKLKKEGAGGSAKTDDEILAEMNEDERNALAELYEKNPKIARQIDAGGKKAQADALKSIREIAPVKVTNPFKTQEKKVNEVDLSAMIRSALRGAERGSNRPTGQGESDESEVRPRTGMNGYFKK